MYFQYVFKFAEVVVTVSHGLPQLTVPLPSRREMCRFTLRPVTHSVADFISQLQHEDKGIDRVIVSTTGEPFFLINHKCFSLLFPSFCYTFILQRSIKYISWETWSFEITESCTFQCKKFIVNSCWYFNLMSHS